MIKIVTDSSSNLTLEEARELGVTFLPLTVMFGTEEYRDGVDLTFGEFYKKLTTSREFPHTSQITPETFEEVFKKAKEEGKTLLVMPIASALSGTYEAALRAKEKVGYDKITVYDTKCQNVMLKIMVTEAAKMADRPVEEVVAMLDDLRPRIRLYAALDTLEYLKKGGRLGGFAATLGTLLKIKPVIEIDAQGNVNVLSKQLGFSKALRAVGEKLSAAKLDKKLPVYFIYTMSDVNLAPLIEKSGIKEYLKSDICPVIGSHIGPLAAGVVYVEES